MKVGELSIGDWVYLEYHFPHMMQVRGISEIEGEYYLQFDGGSCLNVNVVEPIQLTDEILEKNFKRRTRT